MLVVVFLSIFFLFYTFVVTVAWRDNQGVGDGGGGRYGGGGRVQDEVTPRLPLANAPADLYHCPEAQSGRHLLPFSF